MIQVLFCCVVSIALGTLYPAYTIYNAIKTKKSKDCIQWMMYWVVYALFTSVETLFDFFSFWFPFITRLRLYFYCGYSLLSLLYRKFVHTNLLRKEREIDNLIRATQTSSYNAAIEMSMKGVKYVTELVKREIVKAPSLVAKAVGGIVHIGFGKEGETHSERRNRDDGDIAVLSDTEENPVASDTFLSNDEKELQVNLQARDEPILALGEAIIESSSSKVTKSKIYSVS